MTISEALATLSAKTDSIARNTEECAANQALENAKARCPVRSGALKSSLSAKGGQVTASAPYASLMEKKYAFLSQSAQGVDLIKIAAQCLKKAL